MRHLYKRHPLRTTVPDARGIWPLGKLCEFLGTWLARHKRWAVLIATGFGALDLGVSATREGERAGAQSLLTTGAIIGVYLLAAYGLKFGPALLQGQKRGMAEAANLNLMEDYRKHHRAAYLAPMWDEGFRRVPFADFAFLYTHDESAETFRQDETPGLERLATAPEDARRDTFMAISEAQLTAAAPQPEQERHLGTGLEMLEDHFDAGPFTASDRKLEQNYDGHPRLLEARRLARRSWRDAGHELIKRQVGDLWFRFLRSSLAAHVGNAVGDLNERYDNTINAQRLLWPGAERLPLPGLDQRTSAEAHEVMRAHQQEMMADRLGSDLTAARRKLDRALTPMFELATTLRARFDPGYMLGESGDVLRDVRDEGLGYAAETTEDGFLADQRTVRDRIEAFDAWLRDHGPTLATREQAQALRVAFHVNYEHMQDAFLARPEETDPMADPRFRAPFCTVAGRPHPWTQMRIDVQMLHVLSRVRRAEYEALVKRLGAYEAGHPM